MDESTHPAGARAGAARLVAVLALLAGLLAMHGLASEHHAPAAAAVPAATDSVAATHDAATHVAATQDAATHAAATHGTATHGTATHGTATHGTATHDAATHGAGHTPAEPSVAEHANLPAHLASALAGRVDLALAALPAPVPHCDDCATAAGALCLAVLTAAAGAVLLLHHARASHLPVRRPRPAPTSVRVGRRPRPPDPVAELCVSRT